MKLKEPLISFFEKNKIEIKEIKEFVTGAKYTAIMLQNGNIGVCANLGNKISIKIEDLNKPDLNNIEHRILLNAYYNAKFNYRNIYSNDIDIFDLIDFTKYKKITMVGLFKPIVKKFNENRIPLTIFDLVKESSELTLISRENEFMSNNTSMKLKTLFLYINIYFI